jgi:hypothetical protein
MQYHAHVRILTVALHAFNKLLDIVRKKKMSISRLHPLCFAIVSYETTTCFYLYSFAQAAHEEYLSSKFYQLFAFVIASA